MVFWAKAIDRSVVLVLRERFRRRLKSAIKFSCLARCEDNYDAITNSEQRSVRRTDPANTTNANLIHIFAAAMASRTTQREEVAANVVPRSFRNGFSGSSGDFLFNFLYVATHGADRRGRSHLPYRTGHVSCPIHRTCCYKMTFDSLTLRVFPIIQPTWPADMCVTCMKGGKM